MAFGGSLSSCGHKVRGARCTVEALRESNHSSPSSQADREVSSHSRHLPFATGTCRCPHDIWRKLEYRCLRYLTQTLASEEAAIL